MRETSSQIMNAPLRTQREKNVKQKSQPWLLHVALWSLAELTGNVVVFLRTVRETVGQDWLATADCGGCR